MRKGRKRMRRLGHVESPAMTKGKKLQQLRGFDAIDIYYPRLTDHDRNVILYNLLLSCDLGRYSRMFVHNWRVQFDKEYPKATLWSLARGLSEEISRMEDSCETVAAGNGNQKKESKILRKAKADLKYACEYLSTCGPLDTLKAYFVAHLERTSHNAMLQAIQPIDNAASLTCLICSDNFDAENTVACSGDDIHFYCKPCLFSYCTVTVQSGPIQSMSCPIPNCKSIFATQDIKSILSKWDILMTSSERTDETSASRWPPRPCYTANAAWWQWSPRRTWATGASPVQERAVGDVSASSAATKTTEKAAACPRRRPCSG
ncbi:hypothetical protein ACHAWF_014638 [Thalassiosira exigua]